MCTEKDKNKCNIDSVVHSAVYVTIDWIGNPTTTKIGQGILPRKAEMIINDKYYPNKKVGEWPCDPITGKKLEIEPN